MKYLYMNEQERQMQYYQFPKFLLELQLSQNARIIYMLLYDRARISRNGRPRKVYQSGLWGLSIKTKERLDPKAGRGLRFGIVVTLREMNGENRIDDFIKMCMMRGWIVNRLDVQAQADVYFKAEEEITFE